MPTKLSRYCDGLMEAGWLTAIVVVPVFFDIYSSRVFEPDKIALLRTLALVILAAWLVKVVDQGEIRWDRFGAGEAPLAALARFPLALPAAALGAVYIVSTLFSVTPRVSLWGSYQRLQGLYTTLAYLIIFAAVVANLRQRRQVDRLITTAIIASLPVSLYGFLQHYNLDPLPWGGDVTTRVAANMGNAIFVAAYLIMVTPLTLGRLVDSFGAILREERGRWAHITRASAYLFIGAVELAALYFSGSRGPWLGWLTGSFFMFVLLSLYWRKRWLTIGIVGAAVALGAFLILLNIPAGPFEALRDVRGIGRLGHVFETEKETGRVRVLIWEGAARMIAPHPPIEYPDGRKDAFNFLRPLIGYGPESMYVAFNPFYPPELGHWESRTATPDRSHNETWDALAITGFLGLGVYLVLFASVFYYGLKWLGLIGSLRRRNLFVALYAGGGAIGATGFVLWRGIGYFGVGLPFGIIFGLIAYLTLIALFGEPPRMEGGPARAITLIALMAAIISHFAEIHFGIAIAVTRTYFWAFTALLVVTGYILTARADSSAASASVGVGTPTYPKAEAKRSSRRRRRRLEARPRTVGDTGLATNRQTLIGGAIVALMLVTLGYNYLTNPSRSTSIGAVLQVGVGTPTYPFAVSYGLLALVLVTAIVAAVLLASEPASAAAPSEWATSLVTVLGVSSAVGLAYWLWQAGSLAALAASMPGSLAELIAQVTRLEGLLTRYYGFVIGLVLLLAWFLPDEWPAKSTNLSGLGRAAAASVFAVAPVFGYFSNLNIVHADIAFKTAEPFADSRQWPVAITLYQRAIALAPTEDYYYLFLGRGYLELANLLADPNEQANLVEQAERDLKYAQTVNPLNTDHTANQARLYRWWSSLAAQPDERQSRGQTSAKYYASAVQLSPNNATLWNEWAVLYLNVLDQPDAAFQRLSHSLEVDPYYDATHGILGDYYARLGRATDDLWARTQALEAAVSEYQAALGYARPDDAKKGLTLGYYLALGQAYSDLGRPQDAIDAYSEAKQIALPGTNLWAFDKGLAEVYEQVGDTVLALAHANNALAAAPEAEKAALQEFIAKLQKP